jgi:hypothetical protein
MLEFGGGRHLVSLYVAMKRPKSTVLSVQNQDDVIAWGSHVRNGLNVKNMLLFNMPYSLQETVAFMVEAEERYTFQVLPDLEELVGELLPHEFEVSLAFVCMRFFLFSLVYYWSLQHLLGSLLSLAATTFVTIPLPNTRFFSYWESAEKLMEASTSTVAKLTDKEFHIEQKAFETGGSSGGKDLHTLEVIFPANF